jgi:dienelactone hydrolase
MSEKAGCCPVKSEPLMKSDPNYQPEGKVIESNGDAFYLTGNEQSQSAVLVCADIFGYNSSRHRQICDQYASQGYLVIMPDVFRGTAWTGELGSPEQMAEMFKWLQTITPDAFVQPILKNTLSFLESKGVNKVAAVGFCYGTFPVFLVSSHATYGPLVKCGVSMHPSNRVGNFYGLPEAKQAELVECPQLVIPASNDPDNMKADGDVHNVFKTKPFGDKCKFSRVFESVHGFVPRGDLTNETTAKEVDEAMQLSFDFIKSNL